jgi:hypothetical protein
MSNTQQRWENNYQFSKYLDKKEVKLNILSPYKQSYFSLQFILN